MKPSFVWMIVFLIAAANSPLCASGQQYKLTQATTMMGGMKMESTIYVKGMRKRTETSGMMGMGASTSIEQCDLKRTVKLNDKKKLYFIEPFDPVDEMVDAEKAKAKIPAKEIKTAQKGGVITIWYSITDTGERKKMFGFTARHVWTSQKMKPSADACSMKDSVLITTDGWYIDLPEFNCPVRHHAAARQLERIQPDCADRFVVHQQGSGKLGFPLLQTVTIVAGNTRTEMKTFMETVELSTAKLDSMLFEIPPGYQLAKSEEELQDKMDVQEIMKAMEANRNGKEPVINEKPPGTTRIGVFAPTGNEQVKAQWLQQHLIGLITHSKLEAVAVIDEEEAKKMHCDYLLTSEFEAIREGDKAKAIVKVITKRDPNALSSYVIQGSMKLKALGSGTVHSQQAMDGKYDGKIDDAAAKALDEAWQHLAKAIQK